MNVGRTTLYGTTRSDDGRRAPRLKASLKPVFHRMETGNPSWVLCLLVTMQMELRAPRDHSQVPKFLPNTTLFGDSAFGRRSAWRPATFSGLSKWTPVRDFV
ncbi:uncharacterized [Tachysurus ichikawai]